MQDVLQETFREKLWKKSWRENPVKKRQAKSAGIKKFLEFLKDESWKELLESLENVGRKRHDKTSCEKAFQKISPKEF